MNYSNLQEFPDLVYLYLTAIFISLLLMNVNDQIAV